MAFGGWVKTFQRPPWQSEEDVNAFLDEAERISKGDIVKCFEATAKLYGQITQRQYQLCCMALIGLVQKNPGSDLFGPLLRTARTPNKFLVETLGHVLPLVNQPKDHRELVALLGADSVEVRRAGAALAGKVFGRATLEALERHITDRSFHGRREAMILAVQKGGGRAVPLLERVLKSRDDGARVDAAVALGTDEVLLTGRDQALTLLGDALNDFNEDVRAAAIQSFGGACSEDEYFDELARFLESEDTRLVKAALLPLARFSSPRVFRTLEYKFAEGPNAVRLVSLQLLEKIGTDDSLPLLVDGISFNDVAIQGEAVRVLRALTAERRVDVARTLVWLFKASDVNVRRMASEVTSALQDPDAEIWPRLVRFLRDEDWWVRERVLDALVDVARADLLPHLVELLSEEDATLRRMAAVGLGRLQDERAVGALVRAAGEDQDWWTREEAVRAVGAIGDARAVPYVVNFLRTDSDLQVACIDALALFKDAEHHTEIAALLGSERPEVRLAAAQYFADIGDAQHASKLSPLAYDPDPEVAERVRTILSRWNVKLAAREGSDDDNAALERMLRTVVDQGADDLFVVAGRKAYMKQRGKMIPLTKRAISAEEAYRFLSPTLTSEQTAELSALSDVDFSIYSTAAGRRFRVNVFQAQDGLGGVFRQIDTGFRPFEELALPPRVEQFAAYKNGLVLVGGPPGSGKSTTLAALIDVINQRDRRHIITVEDPIEALHDSKESLVNQREVGTDTNNFHSTLRSILRQDPDVILIGELRDYESVSFAIRAAETGHLVFGTVHTFAADTTVERLINTYPADKRDMARSMLSETLRGVLCQFLLPKKDSENERVLATELMLTNDAIRNIIRKNQAHQIPSMITIGAEQGMVSMDGSLRRLYEDGLISESDLYSRLRNKELYEEVTGQTPPHRVLPADHSGGE